MRPFALVVSLCFLASPLTGCSTSGGQSEDRFAHEDIPEAFLRARELEEVALKEIDRANRQRHPARRREFLDRAVNTLREARQLYEDELVEEPGTPEKQKTCEAEMERISDHIARIVRDRPPE